MDLDSKDIQEEVDAILGFEIGVGREIAELSMIIKENYLKMLEGWEVRVNCGTDKRQALMEIAGVWVRSVLMVSDVDKYQDVMMHLIPLLRLGERVAMIVHGIDIDAEEEEDADHNE